MQTQTTAKSTRLYYLDWLRVLAIFMVFMFHAVHPFDLGVWHVKNADKSMEITIGLEFLSWWGMAFFFMVAGTSSGFALQRRTSGEYAAERFKRLMIPFIVGTILFSPLGFYLEWLQAIQNGATTLSFVDYAMPYLAFTPKMFGYGMHLWFLGFLFSFAILTLPLFEWLKRDPSQRVIAWLARLSERRGGILIFIVPLIIVKLVFQPFFPQQNDWADFFYQMAYFILGFVLYSDERFARAIRRDWWIIVGSAILAFASLVAMLPFGDPFMWSDTPTLPQFYLVQSLVVINGFGWSVFMLFVGMRFLNFTNKWLVYAQQAVLPFFILHQPVILTIAFFVVQWNTGILPKLITVVASSFLVTIALYEFVVKRIAPLRAAFGMTR